MRLDGKVAIVMVETAIARFGQIAALYLASDESSWVTRCPLIIDGGMLTR